MKQQYSARNHFAWVLFKLSACLVIFGQLAYSQDTNIANPQLSKASSDEWVKFYVTVTDKDGNNLQGLNHFDFAILCDKQPQSLSYFSRQDEPVGVVFLIDTSGSMKGNRSPLNVAEALPSFLQNGNKQNEYSVIGFNQSVQLVLDWTRNSEDILNSIHTFATTLPRGQTALFNALATSIEQAKKSKLSKRVILVLSDGLENASTMKEAALQRLIGESNILIYAVDVNELLRPMPERFRPLDQVAQEGRAFLTALSRRTGAAAFYPTTKEGLKESLEWIANDLHHQYVIGFHPACKAGAHGFHTVKISLTAQPTQIQERKRLLLRHREAYFADASQK